MTLIDTSPSKYIYNLDVKEIFVLFLFGRTTEVLVYLLLQFLGHTFVGEVESLLPF